MSRQMERLKKCLTTAAFVCVATILPASKVDAMILNGDFETGDLTGWSQSGINSGLAFVAEEGTMFSVHNTTGLTLNGDFAANVRSSSGTAPTNSVGILTSDPFIIGDELSFLALSETFTGITDPVTLEFRILDLGFGVLFSQEVDTNLVAVGPNPTDGTFSTHVFDTSVFEGQEVMLQFRQNTNVAGNGFFTLIDDVETTTARVPEPATVLGSLFALGLGVSQLRKKHA